MKDCWFGGQKKKKKKGDLEKKKIQNNNKIKNQIMEPKKKRSNSWGFKNQQTFAWGEEIFQEGESLVVFFLCFFGKKPNVFPFCG